MSETMIRVLVVDDETAIRFSLCSYLEDEGFEVLQAGSGEEAVRIMDNEKELHVVIVDLRLPDMDGDSFIEKVYQKYPRSKFIIYTGSTNYKIPDHLARLGMSADNIMLKPIRDLNEIGERINRLLSS